MTKEELEKDYYADRPTEPYSDDDSPNDWANIAHYAEENLEKAFKRIADLEKENAELKEDNDARKFAMAMSEKVEKQLRDENTELKGIKDVATLIRANNDTVTTLMQLNNMLVSKRQQLTEAKEIIKIMKHLLFDVWGYIAIPLEKRVNNFLKQSNL